MTLLSTTFGSANRAAALLCGQSALLIVGWLVLALAGVSDEQQGVMLSPLVISLVITATAALGVLVAERVSLATRSVDLLPIAKVLADLVFSLLVLPARIFAAPARARPRPAAGRFGRLPAIALSPRLLPVPTASA